LDIECYPTHRESAELLVQLNFQVKLEEQYCPNVERNSEVDLSRARIVNKSNQDPLLGMVQAAATCMNHDIRYLCGVDKRWIFYFGEVTVFPNHICSLSSIIEIYRTGANMQS